MKRVFNAFKEGLTKWLSGELGAGAVALAVLLLAVWLLGWLMGHATGGVTQIMAAVIGVAGVGQHIDGEPLTTKLTDTVSPTLLRNEIDDRIVKIRPMSTPLDQISRYGGSRLCGSMKVEYYSVDTKPSTAHLLECNNKNTSSGRGETEVTYLTGPIVIKTDNDAIFQPTTTIIVPSVQSTEGGSLVLYVTANDSNGLRVMAVNNKVDGELTVPTIPEGSELVRMGRAATELDVMTSQFESLPTKAYNYCQIFKAQVEQSTFMKIANKEVGWTFSDQEEAAIIDMRLGMEKNFLFGHCTRITDPVKNEEVLLTGGVWNQTDNVFSYDASKAIDDEWLVKLCRQAFSHNAGSSKKVLLAGSDLIEKLHLAGSQRVLINDAVVTKWGLDFTEIHSKFGTLYVLLAEVFDSCGMSSCGMVIDPEYITKYCHVPFRTERLNLRQSGVRNVDAIVITEAGCLVLRYPQSHMKIVAEE
jgi:hypothetical protein